MADLNRSPGALAQASTSALHSAPTATSTNPESPATDQQGLAKATDAVLVGSVKRLSQSDVSYVLRAIGATADNDHPVQIASSSPHLWPPKYIPNGLYKDVIRSRSYSQLLYYICSIFYTAALILQVILGAILTALGATSHEHGTAITVLAVSLFLFLLLRKYVVQVG